MWRKHPIARLIIGLAVAMIASGVVAAALFLWTDFWLDGQEAPRQVEGTVKSISRHLPSATPGHFILTTASGETYEFDLRSSLLRQLDSLLINSEQGSSTLVTVTFSPRLQNIYDIKINGIPQPLVQDVYRPDQIFQDWQSLALYGLIAVALIGVAALFYVVLTLLDWFWSIQHLQGALVARIERAEIRSEDFSIIVRPWQSSTLGKQVQLELNQSDFLATDGCDFVEVTYTRFFHYVRQLRPLTIEDLPPQTRAALLNISSEGMRLSYFPGWRLRVFLYADGVLALLLLGLATVILFNYLPEWANPQHLEPPQWLFLPIIMMFSIIIGAYFLLRFRRKLQDLKAPKRVTAGPVLSKWRVTGTSNDNRRLIVVADGGLAAGEQGVRKFDLSPALFDQLRVGDIVEIEHTPRLRYICRLEVKGHQELTRSYQV
jgi:hypothetical protein